MAATRTLALALAALAVGCEARTPPKPLPALRAEAVDAGLFDPWEHARVGDHLEYVFTGGEPREPGAPPALSGTLTLEVAQLDGALVQLVATVRGADPTQPARSFVIPMDARAQPPLQPLSPRGAKETLALAGGALDCFDVPDANPLDVRGIVSCTSEAAPLYLLGGVARWRATALGRGKHAGAYSLTLTARRTGTGTTALSTAGLPPLFAQGGWYRTLSEREGPSASAEPEGWVDVVKTTGMRGEVVTERFHLVRELRTPSEVGRSNLVPVAGRWFAPSKSPSSSSVRPLVEVLVELLMAELEPPPRARDALPTSEIPLGGHMVAVRRDPGEGPSDAWAADPWQPALLGLPFDVRADALRTETVEARSGRAITRVFVSQLLDWGVGPLPAEPEPATGIEGLSSRDVSAAVVAARARMHCADALPDRSGEGVFFTLKLEIRPDGTVAHASATPTGGAPELPASAGACIARELSRLRFPPHALAQPPWVLDVAF